MSMPWAVIGGMIAYRKSWFDEIGVTTFPQTWEAYREAGKMLKGKGRPLGQTLGHTFGDAPGFTYPYLWSWGGKEVEADGKTVAINSKETLESVKFMTAFWTRAALPGTTPTTTVPSCRRRLRPP
jgi:multiple sugar transport system substrate-binding protein